jgi:hypothetical protein
MLAGSMRTISTNTTLYYSLHLYTTLYYLLLFTTRYNSRLFSTTLATTTIAAAGGQGKQCWWGPCIPLLSTIRYSVLLLSLPVLLLLRVAMASNAGGVHACHYYDCRYESSILHHHYDYYLLITNCCFLLRLHYSLLLSLPLL